MTDEHQALNFTISSPGWMLYLKRGGERQKEYMAQLLDQYNKEMSESQLNYLRGYINALIWSATWPRQEVEQALQEEREQQEILDEGGKYDILAKIGYTAGIDSRQLED